MTQVKGIPDNSSIVIPRLVCRDVAAAIDFCTNTFGAVNLSTVLDDIPRERAGPCAASALAPADRHAANHLDALYAVAVKVEGNPLAEIWHWRVLQMQVDMRLAAVARIAYPPDNLSRRHSVPGRNVDRAGLQVRHEQVLVLGDLQDNVIARRAAKPPLSYRTIGLAVVNETNNAFRRGEHRAAIRVVVPEH